MRSRSKRTKGFTLIELLVVIAIIAILAAILFPVFAQAREAARKASCLSNQKQLLTAMLMYSQDYDERFPNWRTFPVAVTPENPNGKITWIENMQPYCKNKKIWVCPSDSTPGLSATNPTTQNSYWLNAYVFRWSGLDPNFPPSVTLAEINYPATTIVFCDGPANDGQHVWPGPPTEWCGSADWCLNSERRHGGGVNYSFADGHAKWYRVDQLKSLHLPDDSDTDGIPGLLGLTTRKRSNDGSNPWWRL